MIKPLAYSTPAYSLQLCLYHIKTVQYAWCMCVIRRACRYGPMVHTYVRMAIHLYTTYSTTTYCTVVVVLNSVAFGVVVAGGAGACTMWWY